ncbi:unnamed protein product [Symbiodinium necroappetens]|uniref:Uncharacterized protein n=1 Tax=Symbiodinium necroappetens TaxID=1628268 RepID=A0A813CII7_9DINO|nr:unnamed protein product [Symbiodinium necroappetens]
MSSLRRFRCPLRPSSPHHVKWSWRLIAIQMNPDLKSIAPRHIDIYLQSKAARSTRLLFLLAPSLPILAERGNESNAPRKSCVRTPASPALGFVIGHLTSTGRHHCYAGLLRLFAATGNLKGRAM